MRSVVYVTVLFCLFACGKDYTKIVKDKSQQLVTKTPFHRNQAEKNTSEARATETKLSTLPEIERQHRPESVAVSQKNVPSPSCRPDTVKSSEEYPYLFTLIPEPKYLDAKKKYFFGEEVSGVRHGSYKINYDSKYSKHIDGKKWYASRSLLKGNFVNGKKEGTEYEYHAGHLWAERPFKNGVEHGTMTVFDVCGNVSATIDYTNGKNHGSWTTYWDNGAKQSHRFYENGQAKGVGKTWARNGQLTSELEPKEGAGFVFRKEWYENGVNKLDERLPYKKTWYESGYVESEIIPANSTTHGIKRFWYPDGQPMLSMNTDSNGNPVGPIQRWAEDGRVISEAEWKKKSREENFKKTSKIVGDILMLPLEILIYGLK
ncbi:MAG: hypothetical protein OEZ43_02400 [Gammaproteobacteria bacterium]|nr:hypothetical protein [Gammaproteobacteria bacterium]